VYNCSTIVICVVLLVNARNRLATLGFYQTNFVDADYISIVRILSNFIVM